jgi:hypothetical protein
MRWLFADPADVAECNRREQVVRLIDRWWENFLECQEDLHTLLRESSNWDLPHWMQHHLQAIDSNLMWEFGPALQNGGHRLVITPESQRQLRPLVNAILSRAPTLQGWEFYGHRPPEALADVVETVRSLCGGDVLKAVVRAKHDGHRRIALTYYTPECNGASCDHQQVELAAFVATESVLGESLLDRWIGTIDVQPLASDGPRGECSRAIAFARMQPTVEAIIGSLVDQLPEQPCYRYVADAKWSSYELHPSDQSNSSARNDLCVAISARPDVFEALHGGSPFYSDTHSKCGETFCYLKIDGAGEPMSVRARLREDIEAAIDRCLIPRQLGSVIGGGTGVRFSYIDLALTDVRAAHEALRWFSQQDLLPPASWLLFCDTELACEWLPLASSGPPPGIER